MQFHLTFLVLAVVCSTSLAWPSERIEKSSKKQLLNALRLHQKPTPVLQAPAQNGINVALVVQNSKDLIGTLITMNSISPDVIKSLKNTNDWVSRYTYWEFNDKGTEFITESASPDELTEVIQNYIDDRRHSQLLCKNLLVIETLIEVLDDENATPGIEVFLYVYGGIAVSKSKLRILYALIDAMKAKIHVIQNGASILCVQPDDPAFTTLGEIAKYSGGIYSLSGSGFTLYQLPHQYDVITIYNDGRDSCQSTYQQNFTVDAGTWTLSLQLYGDIENIPTLAGPDAATYQLSKIYNSVIDRAFLVTAVNSTSSADKLAEGVWTLSYEIFDSSDPGACGLRVDAQTTIQQNE